METNCWIFLGDRVILKRMFISVWCLQLFRLLRENVLALQAIKWSFVSISSHDILTQTTIRPSARSSIYPFEVLKNFYFYSIGQNWIFLIT